MSLRIPRLGPRQALLEAHLRVLSSLSGLMHHMARDCVAGNDLHKPPAARRRNQGGFTRRAAGWGGGVLHNWTC